MAKIRGITQPIVLHFYSIQTEPISKHSLRGILVNPNKELRKEDSDIRQTIDALKLLTNGDAHYFGHHYALRNQQIAILWWSLAGVWQHMRSSSLERKGSLWLHQKITPIPAFEQYSRSLFYIIPSSGFFTKFWYSFEWFWVFNKVLH